jgi:hypothetical protein
MVGDLESSYLHDAWALSGRSELLESLALLTSGTTIYDRFQVENTLTISEWLDKHEECKQLLVRLLKVVLS